MPTDEKTYSICDASRVFNRKCPETGAIVGVSAGQKGWVICRGRQLLSAEAARQSPSELRRLLAELAVLPAPEARERNYGIVDVAAGGSHWCVVRGLQVASELRIPAARHGQWAIALIGTTSVYPLLSQFGAQQVCGGLAKALFEGLYKLPPAFPPEEIAARHADKREAERVAAAQDRQREASRQRDEQRARAVANIATEIAGPGAPPDVDRAQLILDAVGAYFGLGLPE